MTNFPSCGGFLQEDRLSLFFISPRSLRPLRLIIFARTHELSHQHFSLKLFGRQAFGPLQGYTGIFQGLYHREGRSEGIPPSELSGAGGENFHERKAAMGDRFF
jgi:hypothetical protein